MATIAPDRFYSFKEIQMITGVSRAALGRYARSGTIDAIRLGGNWAMRGDKLLAFMQSGTSATAKGEVVDVDAIANKLHRAEYDKFTDEEKNVYRKGIYAALLAALDNDFLARQILKKFDDAHVVDAGDGGEDDTGE